MIEELNLPQVDQDKIIGANAVALFNL